MKHVKPQDQLRLSPDPVIPTGAPLRLHSDAAHEENLLRPVDFAFIGLSAVCWYLAVAFFTGVFVLLEILSCLDLQEVFFVEAGCDIFPIQIWGPAALATLVPPVVGLVAWVFRSDRIPVGRTHRTP